MRSRPPPREQGIFAPSGDEPIASEGDPNVLMRRLRDLEDVLPAPRAPFVEA